MSDVRNIEIQKWKGRLILVDKETGQPLGGQVSVDIVNDPDGLGVVIAKFRLGSERISLSDLVNDEK